MDILSFCVLEAAMGGGLFVVFIENLCPHPIIEHNLYEYGCYFQKISYVTLNSTIKYYSQTLRGS